MTRKYKKHTMKELTLEARKEIVRLYVEEHMHQSDIAILYRVSKAIVGRLVKLHATDPEHHTKLERKRERQRRTR